MDEKNWEIFFWVKNTEIFWCGSGSGIFFDPGAGIRKFGSGIRDKHPRFEILFKTVIRIRIGLSSDPDPAIYLSAAPDPGFAITVGVQMKMYGTFIFSFVQFNFYVLFIYLR